MLHSITLHVQLSYDGSPHNQRAICSHRRTPINSLTHVLFLPHSSPHTHTTCSSLHPGCRKCTCGRYLETVNNDCTTYGTGAGAKYCKPQACGPGFVPTGAAKTSLTDGCTMCPAGKFQPGTTHDCNACQTCPCGKFALIGSSGCTNVKCPIGKQPTEDGKTTDQDGCTSCAPGKYSALRYNYQCDTCKDCVCGKYSAGQAISCKSMNCSAGYAPLGLRSTGKVDGCTACPCGKYSPTWANEVCLDKSCISLNCPAGMLPPFGSSGLPWKTNPYTKTGMCVGCPAGRFMETKDNNVCGICKICPCGTWSPMGSKECFKTLCEPGTRPRQLAVVKLISRTTSVFAQFDLLVVLPGVNFNRSDWRASAALFFKVHLKGVNIIDRTANITSTTWKEAGQQGAGMFPVVDPGGLKGTGRLLYRFQIQAAYWLGTSSGPESRNSQFLANVTTKLSLSEHLASWKKILSVMSNTAVLTSIMPMRVGAGGPKEPCVSCVSGRFQSNANFSDCGISCDTCPVGTWSSNSSGVCAPSRCPPGFKATITGAVHDLDGCVQCPCGFRGGFSQDTMNKCEPYSCPPGSEPFGDTNTKSMCRECPLGKFQGTMTTPGSCGTATQCTPCSLGTTTCFARDLQVWQDGQFTANTPKSIADLSTQAHGCCRASIEFDMAEYHRIIHGKDIRAEDGATVDCGLTSEATAKPPLAVGDVTSTKYWHCLDYLRKVNVNCTYLPQSVSAKEKAAGAKACGDFEACQWADMSDSGNDAKEFKCVYNSDVRVRNATQPLAYLHDMCATNTEAVCRVMRVADSTVQMGAGCRGAEKCNNARCPEGTFPTGKSVPKLEISIEGFEEPRCEYCKSGKYSNNDPLDDGPMPLMLDTSDGTKWPQKCVGCKLGFYSRKLPFRGIGSCREIGCVAGWQPTIVEATNEAAGCSGCPAGRFKPKVGKDLCEPFKCCNSTEINPNVIRFGLEVKKCDARVCRPCVAGKYQDALESSEPCKVCPCGKYSESGWTRCESSICSSGKTASVKVVLRATLSAGCTKCEAGRYQPLKINSKCSSCKSCAAGRYMEEQGKSDCYAQVCKAGQEYDKAGSAATKFDQGCADCQCGRYQKEASKGSCTLYTHTNRYGNCQPGHVPVGKGRISETFNMLKTASDPAGCVPCVSGKYVAETTRTAQECPVCTKCPCGMWSNRDMVRVGKVCAAAAKKSCGVVVCAGGGLGGGC